jgi:gliding motility-associated-like protein
MNLFFTRLFILPAVIGAVLFASTESRGQGVMGVYPMSGAVAAPTGTVAWSPVNNPTQINRPTNDNGAAAHAGRKRLENGPNYKSFTPVKKNLSAEAVAANAGYEGHPDFGIVYEGAPCTDCYELIGERTETTKTFVREGIHEGGKEKMTQTSTQPMHYRDALGNWRTIKTQLQPDATEKGTYTISTDITPVMINTNAGNSFSSLGKKGERIEFNRNLELIYVRPDGKEVSLGAADYTHHTAGDAGVYVQNAWPGIDIEMSMMRGAIKTNFHVNHALPEYAAGKILIRDHLFLDGDLNLHSGGRTEVSGELFINDGSGYPKYGIGEATVYEQGNHQNTVEQLTYIIGKNNVLDISLPGNYLNKPELSYPIIIDPLVTLATSTTVNGSTYLTALTATSGCAYLNAANTPANCTITDIQFAFEYTTVSPNVAEYAGSFFYKGGCRSPGTLAFGNVWTCGPPAGAIATICDATGGATYSIWGTAGAGTSGLGPCVPAPQCASYPLNITMYFYQSWAPAGACTTTWAYGSLPLVITVIGHTVEFVSATAAPATICSGSSTSLSAVGQYGVPPYTYSWTPGPVTGSPVTVSPAATTTYNLTITDACGITATGATTVTVINEAPITGTLSLCVGNTTTLADATGGAHTWSSSTPGVATITSPGGVVTAVSAGTTTITYTTNATGCTATAVVTVTALPTPILGTFSICPGSTTLLTDLTGGGAWSSSNPGAATISAGGLVTGVAAGVTTITYGSATCYVTATLTVTNLAPITGTLTVCPGNTTTLADAAGGGTWSSGTPGVCTIGVGTGVVTGISGGTSTIVYTTAAGCTASAIVTVNPTAPITGTLSYCPGSSATLNDAVAGGTWSSGATGVATIGVGTGLVTALSNGTSTIVYTTGAGCTVSVVVTVTPLAPITGTLTVCQGNTTTLADAVGGGGWTSGTPGVATIGAGTGLVTGISGGTSTIVYTTAAGCTANAVVTVNPIAPITGTLALCAGATSTLADAAGGGTWSSGTPGVATVGIGTGLVTGISNGTTTVVYTTAAGCTASAVVTVNPLAPITGTMTVCQGGTTTLADAAGAGNWTSGTPAVAAIGAGTGVVTGLSGGTSTIVFTTASGCSVNAVVTVNPITPITGITTVCVGATSVLNDITGGGTWSSTTPGVASITAAGLVTGVSAGTTTISYITAAGCSTTITFTVANVAPITGTAVLCVGATTTLADATAGGTWSSSLPGVATIGVGSGLVAGVSGGTTTITYTSGASCVSTLVVTVNNLPAAITGVTNVCVGLTTTLSDISPDGTWGSSAPGVASVSGAVIVTGVSSGVATITYTIAGGCYITIPVLVNPLPAPIGGGASVCLGSTVTLNDASPGGTWMSNNSTIATINAGGMVTGVSAGSTTITYTLGTGCIITEPMTVIPLPAAPLTANLDYCQNDIAVPLTAVGSNLMWYTVPAGGAGTAIAPIPPTNIPGITTWYVSQNVTGCEGARAPLQVTVHVHPIFSIVPTRPTACQDDTISFAYSGPAFPGEVFSWTLPGNGVLYSGSSLSNSSITMYYDTVTGGNDIMLTVGDGYAPCNAKDTLPMTVYINSPNAAFYVKPNVCFGDSVTIALTHIGPGVTDYTWNFGGASVLAGSSNHGGPFIVTFPSAGIYFVTLTAISNLLCPSVPIIDTVDVHAQPDATFIAVPKSTGTLCLEDSIAFKANLQDANCSYLWQPEHCFNNNNKPNIWGKLQQGRTDIALTVTDPFGCTGSSNQQFSPDACCTVLFPNAFTPNGDGHNDKFRPIFNGYHNFHEFRVVNRWGQTVFESANSDPSWDGSYGGVPQDMGVYYYYIKYDCGGNTIEEKGDLTLVR